MKLSLINFKQYSNYSIELPNRGLVLLKGETGQGKTTLFEAIFHAITGEADDVLPWSGGKPVTVDFEYNTIHIIRTNSPHTLWVEIEEFPNDSVEYKDDRAQAKIYEYFTAHTSEFTAAYYIRQRMEGSLLSFGPAEMLRFIQKLAFGDQDPEVYKKQITDKISHWSGIKAGIEATLKHHTQVEMSMTAKLLEKEAAMPPVPEKPKLTPEDYAVASANQLLIESSIKSNQKEIARLDALIKNPVNIYRAKYTTELDVFEEYRKNATQTMAALTKILDEQVDAEYDFDSLDKQSETLTQKNQFFSWKDCLDRFTAKLKVQFNDYQSQAIAFLSKKQEDIETKRTQITESIEEKSKLMTDLIRSQEIQHCPECDVGLVIRNGKLNLAEHTECASGVDVSDVKSEIDALRVTLRGYGDKLREINALLVEAKILKDTAVKDPNPDIKSKDEIEKKRSEIKKLRSDMEANNRSTELARKEIKSIEQELSLRSNNLLTMKKKIEEGADVLTVEQIDAQKNDINAKIVNLQQLTSDNAADILEYQGYVADKRVYDAIAAQTNEMVEDLTSIKQKIKTTEEKLQDAANMWAGAVRLKEISDNAAISATEGIIGAINQYAEEHINQLFPHGGTAVKIMSGTKTNKGEDRAKLALNVTHKSQPVGKSIGPLSGGEKDRVKVAFQLALAEIYRASFLMLDEPFAGIDFEMTMEICLKLLKSFSSDKLVFMAQHGAPEGLFDAVIEI